MRIGNIELKHGLILAPMAGITDSVFRSICRDMGAEYAVSEMLSAAALCFEQKSRRNFKTASIADLSADKHPCAVQIFGCVPEYMATAAKLLATGEYKGFGGVLPDAVDINMGCPVAKAVRNNEGVALMRDLALAERIIKAVRKSVSLPLTVKFRLGRDKESINAVEFAKMCECGGADAVCVHGRTGTQMYAPGIDLGMIEKVKNAVGIPVVGNGGIFSAGDAVEMMNKTGCDGVAVARGALGNPWIFEEISAAIENRPFYKPEKKEKLDTALFHVRRMIDRKGEKIGINESKKHLAAYTKGMRNCAAARDALMAAESFDRVREILQSLL